YGRLRERGRKAKIYYYNMQSGTIGMTFLPSSYFGLYCDFVRDCRNNALPDYAFIEPPYVDQDDGTLGAPPPSVRRQLPVAGARLQLRPARRPRRSDRRVALRDAGCLARAVRARVDSRHCYATVHRPPRPTRALPARAARVDAAAALDRHGAAHGAPRLRPAAADRIG